MYVILALPNQGIMEVFLLTEAYLLHNNSSWCKDKVGQLWLASGNLSKSLAIEGHL